jgi:hypothetical protein
LLNLRYEKGYAKSLVTYRFMIEQAVDARFNDFKK